MEDNNSFLYPQGFHIGALYFIIKNIGDGNFTAPFNPETYNPTTEEFGTFERECRYRMWALMEMGILEDHRRTNNPLSYQILTDKGKRIYELLDGIHFPPHFFERRSNDSWAMVLEPIEYIRFTQTLETAKPELFGILRNTFTSMDACQDLIGYFLFKGENRISKEELYGDYFSNEVIRSRYVRRGLTPPGESLETARRRVSVILGLLQSVNILSIPPSERVTEFVTLLETPENVSEQRMEEIEEKVEESISRVSNEEIDRQLRDLESHLSTIPPIVRTPIRDSLQPSYPRNLRLVALLKRQRNYICQICGESGFAKPDGLLFISHHHMVPMNRGTEIGRNPDVPSNILIACSWCHDKLEYGTRELKREIYDIMFRDRIINQGKIDELRRLDII